MADEPMGYVVLVLHTHLPWVLGHGNWPHGEAWLHEAAAECYVPLLRMMDRLSEARVGARLTVGLTPVLCEALASPRFSEGFLSYLEKRRERAERDREDFRARGDAAGARLAAGWAAEYGWVQTDFEGRYASDLVGAFRRLQDAGTIEIITSAATHGYLPLLGRDEMIGAQVRAGVASYRRHFRRAPRGIWLPECAYRPAGLWSRSTGPPRSWRRPGLQGFLTQNGLRYFFVDTHLVAGGVPLGTYEDRVPLRRLDATAPARGASPYEVHGVASDDSGGPVAVFARDPRSSVQVWSADYGYPGDGAYLEFHRKKGQDGLRYWRITDRRLPLDAKVPYSPEEADARLRAHADHFLGVVRETLRAHRDETGHAGVVVAPFDTELFGHWWAEGPRWLEHVLQGLTGDMRSATASEFLDRHPPRSIIALPEGSWGQGGHHWVWLNEDTRWVWDLVYRAEDAFDEALRSSAMPPSGLAARILRQLARELLLLESSDWPFLITTVAARDYAEARVREHYAAFERLLKMLQGRAPELPPEDAEWLAATEAQDAPFPDLDLAAWTEASRP